MEHTVSPQELDERIAILKRFRSLLEEQRNKFRDYLRVLEKQEDKIIADDGEAVVAHADLEQQILRNIVSLQKVIVPMQTMYRTVAGTAPAEDTASVLQVQKDLADIQQKVLAQNKKNQDLLSVHIAQIRTQIDMLMQNNPYRGKRSIYADKITMGNMVAIDA